jgi:hypothetical protein
VYGVLCCSEGTTQPYSQKRQSWVERGIGLGIMCLKSPGHTHTHTHRQLITMNSDNSSSDGEHSSHNGERAQ